MALIKKLWKAKREAPAGEKPEPVRTHLRNMNMVPEMIGSIIGVYNVVGLVSHYICGHAGPAAIVIGTGLALSSTAVVLQDFLCSLHELTQISFQLAWCGSIVKFLPDLGDPFLLFLKPGQLQSTSNTMVLDFNL